MKKASEKTAGQIINDMPQGVFVTMEKINPSGALQARRQKTGVVSLFWRYSIGLKSERVNIGLYDSSAPIKSLTPSAKGYSVAAATRKAEALATEHVENRHSGGRPALQQAAKDAAVKEIERVASAAKHTLEGLMNAYADYLQTLGRQAVGDIRSIIKLHIVKAWPKVAAMPANQVTLDQIVLTPTEN